MIWVTTYTVRGSGQFPLDMLRYDQSFPRTVDDAAAILSSGIREVTLKCYTQGSRRRAKTCVTVPRWLSFGWEVITQTTERVA